MTYFRNPNSNLNGNKELFNLDIILSNIITKSDRVVVRYEDFFENVIDYFSYTILFLYCFNTIYNAFRVDVYLTQKFFYKNPILKNKIIEAIEKRISKLYKLN